MTGLASVLFSIAVIAAFVLTGGGFYLIVSKRNRKQGLLMILTAAVTLGNVLIWTI
jgi:hypothetical protein